MSQHTHLKGEWAFCETCGMDMRPAYMNKDQATIKALVEALESILKMDDDYGIGKSEGRSFPDFVDARAALALARES